jgi:hypothetical protein
MEVLSYIPRFNVEDDDRDEDKIAKRRRIGKRCGRCSDECGDSSRGPSVACGK